MNTHILKFTLNEKELNESFLNLIRPLFTDKDIVLSIREKNDTEMSVHAYYDSGSTLDEVKDESNLEKAVNINKGNPGSKGAGGKQPPKITIELS